jgi:sulfopyruvate decarboxylase alpha subunit
MTKKPPQWPKDIFKSLLDAKVSQVAYVPDAGHARLIEFCLAEESITAVPLTSEEEGIGLLAGAWLGGQRAALLTQSSGVGNCVNMLGMARACRFPLLLLVTMRGQWGEFNPWHVPLGQAAADILKISGVIPHPVDEAERVGETVDAAARIAFNGQAAAAVLISQRIIGAKSFGN